MNDGDLFYKSLDEFPWILACRDGYLINSKSGVIIRGAIKSSGYVEVCIKDEDGNRKSRLMHRLIAGAFCERGDGQNEVNHINGVKTDNRSDNLEWVTRNENLRHAYDAGLRKDDVSARSVIAENIENGERMEFSSIYKAARFLGISQGNICMCCRGQRPHANGFYWWYSDQSGNQKKLTGGE